MQFVGVVSSSGKPLMPCHPARARQLVRSGRAVRRFNRGIFYIRMLDREDGVTQPVVVAIDPGSKREAFTVKSKAHTYLNIETHAVTWVKDAVETRRIMRRARRHRNTPYRQIRANRRRNKSFVPPSTKARWQWKLRLLRWLKTVYPISHVITEEVSAKTMVGKIKWNKSFSPLEIGKHWFESEARSIAPFTWMQGYETAEVRKSLGLTKSSDKMSGKFDAHCVDSWVMANFYIGGHKKPDNTQMVRVMPLQYHRRQLHYLQPVKGNVRYNYGSTRSVGFKRGSWVKHPKWGLTYVGGTQKGRVSIHRMHDGKRVFTKANPEDLQFLTYASWRVD